MGCEAAVVKTGLAFWVVPRLGGIGEGLLLTGYLVISTGILVLLGLRMIKTGELEQTDNG